MKYIREVFGIQKRFYGFFNNFYQLYILVALMALIIIYGVFEVTSDALIEVNEIQILYIFSASAQCVSGLFGLSLAGFIFLMNSLNRKVEEDETLIDAVQYLKDIYYRMIGMMGILTILSIALSLLLMALTSNELFIFDVVMNITIIIVVSTIGFIICFGLNIVDPNKIENISDILREQEELEEIMDDFEGKISFRFIKDIFKFQKRKDVDKVQQKKGDLKKFLIDYNSLEEILRNQVDEIGNENKKLIRSMRSIAELLYASNKISQSLYDELKTINKYRNYIIHSRDVSIGEKDNHIMSKILVETKNAFD